MICIILTIISQQWYFGNEIFSDISSHGFMVISSNPMFGNLTNNASTCTICIAIGKLPTKQSNKQQLKMYALVFSVYPKKSYYNHNTHTKHTCTPFQVRIFHH